MITYWFLLFSLVLGIWWGFLQQAHTYQLTNVDVQVVNTIEQIIQQANYKIDSPPSEGDFREQYRELFNKQTSERKKRILFEIYYSGSYLATRKIANFVEHTDLASLQFLSGNYRKDKKNIYYIGYLQDGEIFDERWEVFHILTGVDTATFQVYNTKNQIKDLEHSYNYQASLGFEGSEMFVSYAKDKNHVYVNGLPIQGANPETYEVLPWGIFAKDDNQVFFRHWYAPYAPNIPLQGVDVESFEVVNRFYAKDKQYVYEVANCGGGSGRETCLKRLKNADPKTFVGLPYEWDYWNENSIIAYDKNALYTIDWFRIVGGEIKSFKRLSHFYGRYMKDRNAAYYWDDTTYPEVQIITGADVETFELLKPDADDSAKDKNHIYYQGKIVPEELTTPYNEREVYAYFQKQNTSHSEIPVKRISKTNLPYSWFQLLTGEGTIAGFGIYNNQLYFYGTPIPNIDIKSLMLDIQFENISNDHIIKDKNHMYYITSSNYSVHLITGADTKSFTGITYHYDYPDGTSHTHTIANYYQDKNHMYRHNFPLPDVDKTTFQALGKAYIYGKVDYSKDKSHVYANANIIDNADVKTFRKVWGIEWFDALDKNRWYLWGNQITEI